MSSKRSAALVGWAFAGLLLGCGDDEPTGDRTVDRSERTAPNETQRHTLRDRDGDVLVKPRARGVKQKQLDLLSVTLARSGSRLTVSFLTAASPGPGMVQVLETYDRRQVLEGLIEIRHERGGRLRAVARPPRGGFKPVPVKVVGREAVARAPLNEHTRELVFKWRAYTVSTRPTSEIRDRVPSGVNSIAFFTPGG